MAVEKMKIISIIGSKRDMDKAAQIVVLNGSVHMLDAISELKNNCLRNEIEEEGNKCPEIDDIRHYESNADFSKDEKIIKSLHDLLNIKPVIHREHINETFDYHDIMENLQEKYQDVKEIVERIAKLDEGILLRQEYIKNIHYAKHAGLDIGALPNLKSFEFEMMSLSREKFKKIKLNYENIPSVVIDLGIVDDNSVIATITPHEMKEDAERIFASLNVMRLEIPRGYSDDTEIVLLTLHAEIQDMKKEIDSHKKKVQASREKYEDTIRRAYTALVLEQRQEYVKSEMAVGQNLFYMFGFVPESDIDKMKLQMEGDFQEQFIMVSEKAEERKYGHTPPTKLVNNPLFRPFESLVTMYGIPNYDEKDPTPFFAITYMLMFGAMFGDLGQGFVIFLGGLGLKYILKNKTFGGILSRLGISSMVFGVLYGSVFGSEDIIPGLLIKPMENINTVLLSAVILGVVLLNISYIYSLVNHFRRKDLEEGVFGREGVVGFLFFWTILLTIVDKVRGLFGVPTPIYLVVMAALLLVMVFKQPLAHKLEGKKKLYEESASDYYLEASFGIVETVLSVISNIISFIRVGAFAINHVGLYIAFATVASMVHNFAAGTVILIIGNIIIIGLEGLIVFIQGLRLEFYELFSKYFSGYGIPYMPAQLKYHKD